MTEHVPAAGEGLPSINRRAAIALTATGLFASMMTVEVSATETMSRGLAELIAEYGAYAQLSVERCARFVEAETALDCPPLPRWQPTGVAVVDLLPHRLTFTGSEQAAQWFDGQITLVRQSDEGLFAMVWGTGTRPALERGHASRLARLEMHKVEAVTSLRMQEEAYAPIEALEEAATEATAQASDTLSLIYAEPCHTLADVRAKAAVILHASEHLGLGLYEPDHVALVMKSLLGNQEA